MSLDIIARLDSIVPDHPCIYKAIESLLPLCSVPSHIQDRTWLGVQLSICEFQAANIDYPYLCTEKSRVLECTRALESKATWWTTFSGNYRHMSTICSEYRTEYETQIVVDVYKNITLIQQDYHSALADSLVELRSSHEGLAAQFVELQQWEQVTSQGSRELQQLLVSTETLFQSLKSMHDFMHGLTSNLGAISVSTDKVMDVVSRAYEKLEDTELLIDDLAHGIATYKPVVESLLQSERSALDSFQYLENVSLGLAFKQQNLVTTVDHVVDSVNLIYETQSQSLKDLQSTVNTATDQITTATSQLQEATDGIVIYLSLLQQVLNWMMGWTKPIVYVVLVVFAIWLSRYHKPSSNQYLFL